MIKVSSLPFSEFQTGALPLAVFAYEDAGVAGAKAFAPAARRQLHELAKAEAFKGAVGDCVSVSWNGRRVIVVGLGKRQESTPETQRRAAGCLLRWARERFETLAVCPERLPAALEGLLLGSYRFCEYRKPEESKLAQVRVLFQGAAERQAFEKALAKAKLAAEAIFLVRDLVNRAPSDKTPQSLAEIARGFEGEGVSVEVLAKERMAELGMGALLGVARGSSVEPLLVHLVYKPKQKVKRRIALVGKGVTFDSGGLSLKPPQSMETMKLDMAGAATVLAVMRALPALKPRAEVHGFCALTYNMPGPDAIKPGDVVKAINGKTIEVLNTDAEGRLILADALGYAVKQEPDAIIDLATLTGAVVVALGSRVTGVMGNNRALLRQLSAAAEKAEETLCELPMPRDYKDQIKSAIADLQNIGKVRGEAGSIIGGLFLEEFVEGRPWAHLDIAGTAWSDRDGAYCPAGGTGSLVRTLLEYLAAL